MTRARPRPRPDLDTHADDEATATRFFGFLGAVPVNILDVNERCGVGLNILRLEKESTKSLYD